MSDIDVSKCVHYHDGGCGNDNTMFECCSKNDCIYKQLQQLKQDNEELKKQVQFKNQFRDYAHKYKQCLDEIDGIVKNTCRNRCTNDCLGTKKHCGYGKILQLIKQAKEGE